MGGYAQKGAILLLVVQRLRDGSGKNPGGDEGLLTSLAALGRITEKAATSRLTWWAAMNSGGEWLKTSNFLVQDKQFLESSTITR